MANSRYQEFKTLIKKFQEHPWQNFKYQPFLYQCIDVVFLVYFLHICYNDINLFYLVVYDMDLPGKEIVYPRIRREVTQRNLQILINDITQKIYLKRYIRNFRKHYYSPPDLSNLKIGKGYIIASNDWNHLINKY